MFSDLRTYMGFLQQGLNCLAFCRISIYVLIASEFQGNTLSGVFFKYLAVSRPRLGHSRGDSLTNSMLITAFLQF